MTATAQHKIGTGFGATSTAAEVLAGIDLTGKLALVTGGYSGIGLETTRALVDAGARVIVPARRPDNARGALSELTNVEVDELDLGDLASVAAFADRFLATGRSLDLVINNAGVMACPETRVGPGWEAQFATNHLGHFALVNRLWPAVADGARVVALSSRGHFFSPVRWDDLQFEHDYDKWLAYGQAKTANVLFAVQLDKLAAARNVRAFAVHPGGIWTPLQRHLSQQEKIDRGWIDADGNQLVQFKTPEQGAATTVFAATSPQLAELGGVYLEDCDVAEGVAADADPATTWSGVKAYATDPEQASRLWDLSVELTGVNAFA
ncbi:SDR family NAD(P)-dependent oxidoreductase [Kutzneria buriramensis]|uniref:Probable oxidoreductase n=1 Tax=Kutzneria buriramensis TaxID=1045776 RepID=A0A3E0GXK8_9PSEU|nr:SDR family NAD(P)-dependent oxidoreductase [Kutzneria buriramensis]REH32938.1 NAD(P)-dependent dehydrogenase (short-subunit alcohol dehydrogenase family) [Kutzneria buriramensis]